MARQTFSMSVACIHMIWQTKNTLLSNINSCMLQLYCFIIFAWADQRVQPRVYNI